MTAVRLVDLASAKELVTLSTTDRAVGHVGLSAGGDRLVVQQGQDTLHVWDLGDVRSRLSDLGLDWGEAR